MKRVLKFSLLLCVCVLSSLSGAEKKEKEISSAAVQFYDSYDDTFSTLFWKAPDRYRLEAAGRDGGDVVVLNGPKSWITSKDGFRIPDKEERAAMLRRLELLSFRFDFSKLKGLCKDLGSIPFAGEQCRLLEFGHGVKIIVSEKDRHPRRLIFPLPGKKSSADTIFYEWTPFGEVVLPRVTFASAGNLVTKRILLSVKFNVPVPDSLFDVPEIFSGPEDHSGEKDLGLLTRPHAALEAERAKQQKVRRIRVPGNRTLTMPRLAAVRPGELIFAAQGQTAVIRASSLSAADQKKFSCTPENGKKAAKKQQDLLRKFAAEERLREAKAAKERIRTAVFPDDKKVQYQAQLVDFLRSDIRNAESRIKTLNTVLSKDSLPVIVPGTRDFLVLFFTGTASFRKQPKSRLYTGMPLIIPVQPTQEMLDLKRLAEEKRLLETLKIQYEREQRILDGMRLEQYDRKMKEKAEAEKKKIEQNRKQKAEQDKRSAERAARRKAAAALRKPPEQQKPEKANPTKKERVFWNPLTWF